MKKRASQYTERYNLFWFRYKKIKYNLEVSKEAGDKDIDIYLL